MKVIAMIPARLGSKRVKNKNLRLLGGKPLIAHVIETVKETNIFDEIYINSESDVFKQIADSYGINFYKRPSELSTDEATNDDFTLDFMENIKSLQNNKLCLLHESIYRNPSIFNEQKHLQVQFF